MTSSTILSPLMGRLREETTEGFLYSPASTTPRWPSSAREVADTQLADDLHHAFCRTGYAPLRHIGVDHHDGHVRLEGRVPTYFLKQLAQSLASSFPGVRQIHNEIEVVSPR